MNAKAIDERREVQADEWRTPANELEALRALRKAFAEFGRNHPVVAGARRHLKMIRRFNQVYAFGAAA